MGQVHFAKVHSLDLAEEATERQYPASGLTIEVWTSARTGDNPALDGETGK